MARPVNRIRRILSLILGFKWSETSVPTGPTPPAALMGLGAGLYIAGPTDELIAGAEQWNATAEGYPLVQWVPQERVSWH